MVFSFFKLVGKFLPLSYFAQTDAGASLVARALNKTFCHALQHTQEKDNKNMRSSYQKKKKKECEIFERISYFSIYFALPIPYFRYHHL